LPRFDPDMMKFQPFSWLLIALLSFTAFLGKGQDTLSRFAGEGQYIIRYLRNPPEDKKVNSEISREIAKVTQCGLKNATVTVHYRYDGVILRMDGRCQVKIELYPGRMDHLFIYRSFDMTSPMRPSWIRIFGATSAESDGFHQPLDLAERSIADTVTLVTFLEGFCPDHLDVELDSISFTYLPEDLDRLYRHERYIDDYHALPGLSDQAGKTLKGFDPEDCCSYLNQFIALLETRFIINHFEKQDLTRQLALESHDPLNFTERFQELKRLHYSLFYTLKDKLKEKERLACYQEGNEWIPYLIDRLVLYKTLSFQAGDAFAPVYASVPDGFIHIETLHELDTLLAEWFRVTGNDYHPGIKDQLFVQVEDLLRKRISQALQEEQYALAMELLHDLSVFCQDNPFTTCGDHEEVAEGTVEGVFMAYLGIAGTALDMGKNRFGMEYLEKARKFLEKNKHPRRLEEMLEKSFVRIVDHRSASCQALSDRSQYDASVACYSNLINWCENNDIPGCREMVQQKIRDIRQKTILALKDSLKASLSNRDTLSILRLFQLLNDKIGEFGMNPVSSIDQEDADAVHHLIAGKCLQDGIRFLDNNHPYHALDCFAEARSILKNLPGSMDSVVMDSLICISRKKVLIVDILTANRNMARDLEHAWNHYMEFRKSQDDMKLKEDGEVNKALFDFLQKYDREKCQMVREISRIDQVKTGEWLKERKYEELYSTYRRIRDIVGLFPECHATVTGLEDSIAKYHDPAAYLGMIRNLRLMIDLGEYPSVFSMLPVLQQFYEDHHLKVCRLDPVTIDDFLYPLDNQPFRQYYPAWLLEEGKPVESLHKVFSFREAFPAEDIDPVFLKKLGKAFGNLDLLDDPSSDPIAKSAALSRDAVWMEPFRSGYLVVRKPPWKLNLFGK